MRIPEYPISNPSSARQPDSAALALRPVALMFPGLGDHYLDMGLDLYRSQPVFRETSDVCAELLKPELGLDIRDIIYAKRETPTAPVGPVSTGGIDLRKMLGRDGGAKTDDQSLLNRTCYAQPALFVTEYALASLLRTWGIEPDAMIGYSLGEYVAACIAGVLSLEDSLTIVARRAALIEGLPAGAMLAVSLSERRVAQLLGAHLSLAASNGPELSVVAGPTEEIERLEQQLARDAVVARRVKSSHAFHSKMMAPIANKVTALMRGFMLRPPRIPYVSNVTGALIEAADATDPAYFARHLCQTVRFSEGVSRLLTHPERILLEAGPGQTLSSMAMLQGAAAGERKPVVVASMRHNYDLQSDPAVLQKAIDRLWASRAAVAWDHVPTQVRDAAIAAASAPEVRAEDGTPASETEQKLAEIWKRTLPVEHVERDTSFFDVGGNSVLAIRLILRISRGFGVKLSVRRLYEMPTLTDMANGIDQLRAGERESSPAVTPKASHTAATTSDLAGTKKPRLTLPNGLTITHQNEAETRHFYSDIFEHRSYVRHDITIGPGACVFDVGSNVGLFTLFAHNEAENVRVFAFDPAPPIFDILRRNVVEHGVQATLVNCGISNRNCQAEFTFYPRSAGMSSFHPDEAEEKHVLRSIIQNQRQVGMADVVDQVGEYTEELIDARLAAETFTATLRRLSDVIREHDVHKIDLLKIDVQKCELEVLEGIDDEDWPKIAQVAMEVHDIDGRVATIERLLARHGFRVNTEHDAMYVGTNIHNIYGVRTAS